MFPFVVMVSQSNHQTTGIAITHSGSRRWKIFKRLDESIDDQEVNISLLRQVLDEAGYVNVPSTMNSREVCALYLKHGYDLILLDFQIPDVHGFRS